MTCYENVNKVMGLKAANAFWNPFYYSAERRTITKQLLFVSEKQLQSEIRGLIWIAMATNRSLILPNALGSSKVTTVDLFKGLALWPGFRLAYVKSGIDVDIIEPAYYWRVSRDYSRPSHSRDGVQSVTIPQAHVLGLQESASFLDILHAVAESKEPRLILNMRKGHFLSTNGDEDTVRRLRAWADDSVGLWSRSYEQELNMYGMIVGASTISGYSMLNGKYNGKYFLENVRLCKKVFAPMRGNRRLVHAMH